MFSAIQILGQDGHQGNGETLSSPYDAVFQQRKVK